MDSDLSSIVLVLCLTTFVSAFCISMTRMATQGKLDRHSSAGIHTPHTQASDVAWQEGHTAALPLVYKTGWVAAITTPLIMIVELKLGQPWAVITGVAGIQCEMTILFYAMKVANKATRSAVRLGI